jgi:hypothetical protein
MSHIAPSRFWALARSVLLIFAINLGFAFLLSLRDPRAFIHPFITAQVAGFSIALAVAASKPWRREHPILTTLAAVVVGTVGGVAVNVLIKVAAGLYGWDYVVENFWGIADSTLAIGLNGLFVCLFFLHYFREQAARTQAHRFERQMAEAELKLLQAQVEPHFLVNTLSNVQFLIEIDPPRAAHMMGHLIEYLQASIPQLRGRSTTLGQEAKLVNAYLSIMAMRMGRRLQFAVDVPVALEAVEFAPLMLLSLVENAIKHGIEPAADGGEVRVTARCEGGKLHVAVTDTGRGLGAGAQPPSTTGSGLGLTNLRERLAALYGGHARLDLRDNSPRGAIACIEIDNIDQCLLPPR